MTQLKKNRDKQMKIGNQEPVQAVQGKMIESKKLFKDISETKIRKKIEKFHVNKHPNPSLD